MIENGPTLATWKTDTPPENAQTEGIRCDRIADHRPHFLDYEGPVSSDRGHVARHDEGICRVPQRSDAAWRVVFEGKRLEGVFLIEKEDQGASWRLRRLSP